MSTRKDLQPSNSKLNCEMDSSNSADKPVKFNFTKDGLFTFKRYETNEASEQHLISLRIGNILFEIKTPELANEIRKILSSALEKHVSKEEFQNLKRNSKITNNAVSIIPEADSASHDNTNQLPMVSENMAVSTNSEQKVNLMKKLSQSLSDSEEVKVANKCINCRNKCVLFGRKTYKNCRLCKSSNITLKKIDTFGTSTSSFNSIPIEKSDITIISSGEEDDQPPVITKMNPQVAEDQLLHLYSSINKSFKIKDCQTVYIANNFKTEPISDMLITEDGVLVTVKLCTPEKVNIDLKIENIIQFMFYTGENCAMIISYDNIALESILSAFKIKENDEFYDQHFKSANRNVMTSFFSIKKNEKIKFESLLSKLPEEKITVIAIDRVIKVLQLYNMDEKEIKKFEKEESHITYKLSKANKRRSLVFSTSFYNSLTMKFSNDNDNTSKKRYERVIQTTKNVDIFKKDFIFVPINEKFQWFLAVICFPYLSDVVTFRDDSPLNVSDNLIDEHPQKIVELKNEERSEADLNIEDFRMFILNTKDKQGIYYDSDVITLKKKRRALVKRPCILILDSSSAGFHRARVTATLREWLHEEYIAKHKGKKKDFSSKVMKGSLVKVPQQPNNIDCSLYMIHFLKMFFDKPIIDYTFPIFQLENWFFKDDVVKNCQKRKEVLDTIISRMNVYLPNNYELPAIKFDDF
ncbi:uncharacterized protein LOC113558070 [Rhopalosiphum maidis]|uniref:uncharacterized protein LOC113558070 n=1 Tax=Rhopalosiphum maidis TaxID=43146 RepID=UPI000EFF8417|nr:uncharacterized protein LOC113558070 [Rhopalosiphum maidis]